MSGSGMKNVIINTQERAVSPDINRLQSLGDSSLMLMLREWLMGTAAIATGTPLRAEVLSGLYAKPVNGSFQIQVAAGAMICVETPANPDDDPLHLAVLDADYTNPILTVTANVSGNPRIDFLECQRTEVILETDSRDIFNDTTGLFTAQTVNKVKAGGIQFRIRAGTPSGGVPTPATGWLPLAAILVPSGSLSLDTCTLWDLRPLIQELDLEESTDGKPRFIRDAMSGSQYTNSDGVFSLQGSTEWALNNRVIGGVLQSTSPGTLKGYVPQTDASPGFAPIANQLVFGYLCFPSGLPRWSVYTQSGSRVPTNFRGIFTLSTTPCDGEYQPTASIALPAYTAITGSGVSAGNAACVVCGVWDGMAMKEFESVAGVVNFAQAGPAISASALGISTNMTLNTHFPAPIKMLDIEARKSWSTSDAFFAPTGTARAKIFDMNVGYTFNAPFLNGANGSINFGFYAPSIVYNTIGNTDGQTSGRGKIPVLSLPAGQVHPSIAFFIDTDPTTFIDMSTGLVTNYGATPVSPLTRIQVWGWQWAN